MISDAVIPNLSTWHRRPPGLESDASLADAIDLLVTQKSTGLVVMTGGEPSGWLTTADVLSALAKGHYQMAPVGSLPLSKFSCVNENASLFEILSVVLTQETDFMLVQNEAGEVTGSLCLQTLLLLLRHQMASEDPCFGPSKSASGTAPLLSWLKDTDLSFLQFKSALSVSDKQTGPLAASAISTEQGSLFTSISEKLVLERKFEVSFQLSPIAMALTDLETGKYIEVNEAFESVTGYKSDEVIGRSAADLCLFIHHEQRARVIERLREQGSLQGIELEIKTRSGVIRNGQFSARLMNINGREILFTLMLDQTEKKVAEKELIAERDLFAGGPVGVLIWRPEAGWRITYVSPNIMSIIGYSPDEIRHTDFNYSRCVHPDDAARVGAEVERFFSEGRTRWEQRYRVIHKGGRIVWLYDYTVAERDSQGNVQLLRGYVMDDSSRVESEARLRLSASVFDHAHEAILITDSQQKIVEVNPTFTEITGFNREEVMGLEPSLLKSGRQDSHFYTLMRKNLNDKGFWRGEISNRRKNGEVYTALMTISAVFDENAVLANYVSIFSDITQMKSHQEKLELLAHYDSLTKLPNRVLLADRMSQALARTEREGHYTAVCYLDLDGFKPVNDHHGHDVGDLLLVEIAKRLKQVTRGEDTVARLGGDEFVLLLTDLESIKEAELAAERILSTISSPILIGEAELQVSASMGITLYPDDDSDADLLLRHADQAMYQAKLSGRNRYQLYDLAHDQHDLHRREFLDGIRQALKKNEFELYMQPQVDLVHGQVLGFEALIRWQHPEHGLLLPARFLPIVEGHELGIEIDHWVLQQAFSLLDSWLSQGVKFRLSVNLTGATLLSGDFIQCLHDYMDAFPGVSPGMMEFEVLETSALEDMHHAGQVFKACQTLGFRIALDDFGTGYSSLTYFRRLPAETLKIDQSFIRDMLDDPEDMAIVESVIGLARAFNRQLVAEGVESAEHGQVLVQLGCTVVQGYGIARPMPGEQALTWAQSWSPGDEWQVDTGYLSPEHRALVLAEMEHIRWLNQLTDQLNGNGSPGLKHYGDSHNCRFGRWYYGLGRVHLGHRQEFIEIEPVHHEVHRQAQALIEHYGSMSNNERFEKQRQLVELSHSLQAQISRLKVLLQSN
ncbi:MAG: EAL domain-containing protein [Pontibacterium sp.]